MCHNHLPPFPLGFSFLFPRFPTQNRMLYSGLHDALYALFGRLLRTLWTERFIRHETVPKSYYGCAFSQRELERITQAFDHYWDVFLVLCEGSVREADAAVEMQERLTPEQKEKRSIAGLHQILHMTVEGLDLLMILTEEPQRLNNLLQLLPESDRRTLTGMTFAKFVTDPAGGDVAKKLIKKLLDQMSGAPGQHGDMRNRLNEKCPNLFNERDMLTAEAEEALRAPGGGVPPMDKLKSALNLYRKIFQKYQTFEDLPKVCEKFADFKYYDAARILVLECARSPALREGARYWEALLSQLGRAGDHASRFAGRGPGGAAFEGTDLEQLKQAYAPRYRIYEALFGQQHGALTKLVDEVQRVRSENGEWQELYHQLKKQIEDIQSSDDDIIMFELFPWMLEHGMEQELAQCKSPLLEKYLRLRVAEERAGPRPGETREQMYTRMVKLLDVLGRHFEELGKFYAAGMVYHTLATEDFECSQLQLEDRWRYVGKAKSCTKNEPVRTQAVSEFALTLQELSDIISIQRLCEKSMSTFWD